MNEGGSGRTGDKKILFGKKKSTATTEAPTKKGQQNRVKHKVTETLQTRDLCRLRNNQASGHTCSNEQQPGVSS